MRQRPICRHCHLRPANRARGLCFQCYYQPSIKDLYAPQITPIGIALKEPQTKPIPTTALPGSPDKKRILAERASREEELWHPDDPNFRDEEND